MKKRVKKKYKLSLFKIIVFITALISTGILVHDLIVWAIIPLFTGEFICLTYFGFFIDLTCAFILETTFQYYKEI